MRLLFGITTAPARAQMAESLDLQVLGWMIWWRSAQSELNTPAMRPLLREMLRTCPW